MADRTHKTVFELSAVDKATQVFKQVEGSALRLRKEYLAIGAAGAAVFAGGAFIADAARYRAALDDIHDTTGDNVTTLDAMARVARASGQELEQMGSALGKFARNLNAADDEGKAAAQAIGAIGLNVQELRAMKPADAMLEVANALNKFEDGAAKVAVAEALMGKEGRQQLPFLKDLAEAGALQGKVTAEQAAQAERLEKEWRKLKMAMADSKDFIATGVIPVMADLSAQMREGIRIAGGFGSALLLFGTMNPFRSTGGNIASLSNDLEQMQASKDLMAGRTMQAQTDSINRLMDATGKRLEFAKFMQRQEALSLTGPQYLDARDLRAKPWLNFVPTTAKKQQSLSPYEARVLELQQQAAKDASGGGEFIETSLAIKAGKYNKIDEATGKVRALTEAEKQNLLQLAAARDTEASYKALREEKLKADLEIASTGDAENRRLVDLAEHYKDLTTSSRALIREEEQLADLRRRGLLTEAQYQEILIVRSEKAREQIIGIGKETEVAAAAGQQLGLSFTSAMDQIAFGSGKAVHGLDLVKAAALDVMKVIYGKQVTGPVAEALSLGITRAFGPRPSYPDASSITGPYGGFDAGAIAGADFVGSFAVGTDYVPRTGFALVHQGEKITPAGENGGGVTVVQHINFAVGIRGEVRAEIANMLPHLARAAEAAVRDGDRRGRG